MENDKSKPGTSSDDTNLVPLRRSPRKRPQINYEEAPDEKKPHRPLQNVMFMVVKQFIDPAETDSNVSVIGSRFYPSRRKIQHDHCYPLQKGENNVITKGLNRFSSCPEIDSNGGTSFIGNNTEIKSPEMVRRVKSAPEKSSFSKKHWRLFFPAQMPDRIDETSPEPEENSTDIQPRFELLI